MQCCIYVPGPFYGLKTFALFAQSAATPFAPRRLKTAGSQFRMDDDFYKSFAYREESAIVGWRPSLVGWRPSLWLECRAAFKFCITQRARPQSHRQKQHVSAVGRSLERHMLGVFSTNADIHDLYLLILYYVFVQSQLQAAKTQLGLNRIHPPPL